MWIAAVSISDPSATGFGVSVCWTRREAKSEARRLKAYYQPEFSISILKLTLVETMWVCGIIVRKPVTNMRIISHLQELLPYCAPLARRHVLGTLVNISDYWRVRAALEAVDRKAGISHVYTYRSGEFINGNG